MEPAFSPRSTSLEGVWHQALKTNWAWKYAFFSWVGFNLCANVFEYLKMQYYSSAGIIYLADPLAHALGSALGYGIAVFVFGYLMNNGRIPAMLRFDDAGIGIQLKTGMVVEAGWNLVKGVRYDRFGKLTVIGLRGMFIPFTGNFQKEVTDALMARAARMRQGPPEPAEPTLEDEVDRRLAA